MLSSLLNFLCLRSHQWLYQKAHQQYKPGRRTKSVIIQKMLQAIEQQYCTMQLLEVRAVRVVFKDSIILYSKRHKWLLM